MFSGSRDIIISISWVTRGIPCRLNGKSTDYKVFYTAVIECFQNIEIKHLPSFDSGISAIEIV